MMTTRPRRLALLLPLLLASTAPALAAGGLPKVPDDFEARLLAYVPAIHFPSQVATAPGGGVFIAEDPMDQEGPYEASRAKILLLRAGKPATTFAEGFRAIFGMTWHDGALYVSHMPFLTVLRDTDGDGVADTRQELFRDLGIVANKGLNDHIVSGLQFGIDNRLYIAVGDKGVFHATGPDGRTAQLKGGGTIRCRADGTEIEVLTTGTRNHLEPNLDAQDNLFTYDNTDDGDGWWTRVTHHVDGGYYGYPYDYHKYPDRFLDRLAEYGGGSPTGGLVYREDAWPERYRGQAFWAEWGKGKVQGFRFDPAGASFKVGEVIDFAQKGNVTNFHPIDLALSDDGRTMYLADWGMGGWGSKTEQVGTVYAITYKGPAIATRPRGTDADPLDAQFRQLDHPSYNERMRAQAAIIRAGRTGWDQARAMLVDPAVDPVTRRHLVWVVDALADDAQADLLFGALLAREEDVRAQATRAIGMRRRALPIEPLIGMLKDPSPAVRLQAIIALGRAGDPRGVYALLPVLVDPDRTLAFSARQAIRRIGSWGAIPANLKAGAPQLRAAILATLEGVESPGAVFALNLLVADSDAPSDERARALGELALVVRQAPPWDGRWWGTRPSQAAAPARTVDWEATPTILRAIEAGLADPAPPVRLAAVTAAIETTDRAALPTLRGRFAPGTEPDPQVRAEVARALGKLGDKEAIPALVAAVDDAGTAEGVRDAALTALEAIGGAEAARPLVRLLHDRGDSFAEPSLIRVIRTLGRFKAADATPDLVARLASPAAPVRSAAVAALAAIGPAATVAPTVRTSLRDPDLDVRKAALAGLGRLKNHDSVPAMLDLAVLDATRFEAMLALADVPDVRALPAYLQGLTDKSQDIRKASSRALVAIREEAAPALERLGERREISPAALPELRKVYNQFRPVRDWHLIGPLPLDAPPLLAVDSPVDLAAKVVAPSGQELAWRSARGEGAPGKLDLARFFTPDTTQRAAYGVAEFPSESARSTRMLLGCDDRITVWLNGEQVHKVEGNHSYAPDTAEFAVRLHAGANRLFVRSENDGGPWEMSVAVSRTEDFAFLHGPAPGAFDPDKHRAVALDGRGQADHGRALFADLKGLACIKCHAVGGEGGNIGPNLSGIATMYPRGELITSILAPSARIFSGYETSVVATADGRTLTGLIRSDTADGLEIEDANGQRTRVAKGDVEERKTSDLSLMPSGIVEGISPQDFADLVAYLETLKNAAANQGQPGGK